MAAGTDSNVRVYRGDEGASTAAPAAAPEPPAVRQNSGAVAPAPGVTPTAMQQQPAPAQGASAAAQLHFEPATVVLKAGDTTTLGLAVSNVHDLYSIPLMIHFDPAVVHVEEVRDGGFLSGGSQQVAVVQRIDQQQGQVIVSATRQPNTPGVNGTGTVFGFVVRAVGHGTARLQILQVNAHDSQQQTIPMVSGEATIQVQ
jgi:plastocyanin